MEHKRLRVTVVDMQPITPAVGGGRQRLLGLYHALGPDIDCTYVGTYDWPGESRRDQQITPGLREIVVPLSDEHHAAAAALSKEVGGRTVIDIAFFDQVHLSPDFLRAAREHVAEADVVVFSHPWCFPPLASAVKPEQLIVYESHNVETLLRTSLLDELPPAKPLLNRIGEVEYALCERADLVLVCSQEDADLYVRLFETDPFKLRIVPNGAFVERFTQMPVTDRLTRRKTLGLPVGRPLASFLGSMYGPNVEAARFISDKLALRCPDWHFLVIGSVGEGLDADSVPNNVIVTGRVNDAARDEMLLASDMALNPMCAGSGTNIKMFDYMAAGLPVLTTEIGARGICTAVSAPKGIFVAPIGNFPDHLADFTASLPFTKDIKDSVRATVQKHYSWERISPELGKLLQSSWSHHVGHSRHQSRVSLLSTWNITCGIAEHTSHLASAFHDAGADVLVIGNSLDNHQSLGFQRDLHTAVVRAWRWDNVYWCGSGINPEQIEHLLRLGQPDTLIIQHHTGFLPLDQLLEVISRACRIGVRTIVEMHNARAIPVTHKEQIIAAGANLIVHHEDEASGISGALASGVQVFPLPTVLPRFKAPVRKRGSAEAITIGGFGFLRPYKGLLTAIRTLSLLRRKYPRIRYHGWHALYSGDASQNYLKTCLKEAERLDLSDAIVIDTQFLPIEVVTENLHSVDVVLMAYEPSEEGASAAANTALAAARPVVTSPSSIFAPVANVVKRALQHAPESYAAALDDVLSNEALAARLCRLGAEWSAEHSYGHAVDQLLMQAPNQSPCVKVRS